MSALCLFLGLVRGMEGMLEALVATTGDDQRLGAIVQRPASFDLVYHSLASAIILLFWVYISGIILILDCRVRSGAAPLRTRQSAPWLDPVS